MRERAGSVTCTSSHDIHAFAKWSGNALLLEGLVAVFDSPYRRVAVAIDGSPAADAAIGLALDILDSGGELVFIHATDRAETIANYVAPRGSDMSALESVDHFEHGLFESARRRAVSRGFKSSNHAVDGHVSHAIVDYINRAPLDAVVMGTRIDRGIAGAMLESTAETVLRTVGIPTFVCPESTSVNAGRGIKRIMVAIDSSGPSATAVACAIGLARRIGADIEFANVKGHDVTQYSRSQIISRAACDQALRAGLNARAVVLHGATTAALTAASESSGADLIVVGTHGRKGRARLRFGSVAEAVVRNAVCPVMVVPGRTKTTAPGISAAAYITTR